MFVQKNRKIPTLVGSLCAAALTLAAADSAHAGLTVIDIGGGWQASWDDALNPFLDVNPLGVVGDAVFIQKSAEFTSLSSIIVTFTQTSPTAVSNIVIDDEIIANSSGFGWASFDMDVVSVGGGSVAFDPVATAASGGFSVGPFAASAFSNGDTTFSAFGGPGVPNGSLWFPGLVSGQLWIHANLTPTAATTFILVETPEIPAPGALALLGVAGFIGSRRRRG